MHRPPSGVRYTPRTLKLEESLARFDAFGHFSSESLARLAGCASRTRFPPGVTVVTVGDATRDAYLVEQGRVRIERNTPYGKFVFATLAAGELFGETAFVDGGTRTSDVVTDTGTHLVTFNPVALSAATEKDRALHLALLWCFWKSLSTKLRQTNQELTRFFSESGGHGPATAASPEPDRRGFRVDVSAKRELFAEQRLSSMEIHFLASLSKERELAADEVLFREGEPGDTMYVVLEGRVMISKFIPGAGEEALAFLERGDYFGEMALIDREPRSADARAADGGAVVLAMPREVVEGILDIHKVSSVRMLELLCTMIARRLRELDDKIAGWFVLSGGEGG